METKQISKLTFERIVVGEVGEPCDVSDRGSLRDRLEEIRASNEEILRRYPPDFVARRIESRLESGTSLSYRPVRGRYLPRMAFAAAAVVVLVGIIAIFTGKLGSERDDTIRIKGRNEAVINVYRQTEGDAERLSQRALVQENDLIQIAYVSPGESFGTVMSIDGRGVVTVHYPYGNESVAGELATGGEHALEYSYRLDDAPQFERFFLLTSDTQFYVADVISAMETLGDSPSGGREGNLELPSGIRQYSFTLIKENVQ